MSRAVINSMVKYSLWLGSLYSYLPRRIQQELSAPLGALLYWLASPRRLVVARNLSLCFPSLSEAQRLDVSRQFFRNVIRAFLDLFQLWRVEKDELKQLFSNINPENKEMIFSCGSGITACVLALGAAVVGNKNMSVYDGSWTEWGSLHHLPIEK